MDNFLWIQASIAAICRDAVDSGLVSRTGEPHSQEADFPYDPTVGLCLEPYGGPRRGGGAVSYERGAPVVTRPVLAGRCRNCSNEKRFRGGLVLKARRLLYHATLGSRVIAHPREARDVRILKSALS